MSEVLSPAGSCESLMAALDSGADAVYFGSEHFSARQNAANFKQEEIPDAVFECHKRGVKIYQAINTVYFDDERCAVLKELEFSAGAGIDGLIIQDLGVLSLAKECIPDMPLHASTQMTIHSPAGAIEARKLGFSRVVLSRECSLDTIKEIVKTGIETEVFVHGALCMSVSGQCYLSAMLGSRSANRGLCAGACRLPFSAREKRNGEYALSLKDLCALDKLKELERIGVTSFKIEGRMKRPEYVAAATRECKNALDTGNFNKQLLQDVFSRSGFTNGYINNKVNGDMFGFRQKQDVLSAKNTFQEIREGYKSPFKRSEIDFCITAKRGEEISLSITDIDGVNAKIYGDAPDIAKNRAMNDDIIKRQLSKLGDTVYKLREVKICMDDDVYIPVSQINSLRRSAVDALDKKRAEKNTVIKDFKKAEPLKKIERRFLAVPSLRIRAQRAEQLKKIDIEEIELISLPFSEILKTDVPKEKLCLSLDRFMTDEQTAKEQINRAGEIGITHFLAQNIAHFELLKGKGIIHAGYGMNITNSDSLAMINEMGAEDAELSFEMKERKINALNRPIKTGIIVYGRLPLMLLRNCPIKAKTGSCNGCSKKIYDRMGKAFLINCHKEKGYFELLNSEVHYLLDKDIKDTDFKVIMLECEDADGAKEIVSSYFSNDRPCGDFTRGLYYRGIL